MSENKFELIIENGVVTGYKGQSKVVEIPEGVTEIGEFAFQDCKFVEEVHSNSTVLKTIGMMAFENCKNLKVCKLKVLKGSIEDNAFSGCEKLKSFVIPNGTIKIGSCAFDYCKELLYLVIPSSVFVIEGYILEIGNKKTVILGDIGSEAEEYAKSKMLPFKENTQATRNEFLQLENKKDNTGYKDFNIFGETVRCYKSILIQEEIVSFFEKLSDDFKAEVFKCVPKSVNRYDREFVKLSKLSELYVRKTRDFLQKYGVFINDTVFMAKTMEYNANYITICRTLVDTYCEIVETVKQGEANIESSLIAEAESKITGLDYGIIGTRTDLLFHAIDEYRAEKRQRKEAYAVANSKMQSATSQMYSKAEKIYIDFLNHTALPSFYKAVEEICNGLMNFAVEEMIEAKVIAQEVFNIYDISKSNKLIEQAKKNPNIDKEYAIATALKMYPLNIEVIVYVVKNNLIENDLVKLIEYLQLYKNKVVISSFEDRFSYVELTAFLNKHKKLSCNNFKNVIEEIIEHKANSLIRKINDYYDPMKIDVNTWNLLIQNYPILYPESVKKYNITEETVKGPNGRELLSKAIVNAKDNKKKLEEEWLQAKEERRIAIEKKLKKEQEEKEEAERLAKLKEQREKEKKKRKNKIIFSLISFCIVFAIVLYTIVIPKIKFRDIVAISAGSYHTVALKSDGTVVATGKNDYDECEVGDWTDIIAISAGYSHTVGLRKDGTVIATGYADNGECNVGNWTNIIAVSTGDSHTVGLKSDGTVVAVGRNRYGQCDVGGWTDIIAIAAHSDYTIGLKRDGTVVATGENDDGQCFVWFWKDIVAVSGGNWHSVGLKSDGTVVAVGRNRYGQCLVGGMW